MVTMLEFGLVGKQMMGEVEASVFAHLQRGQAGSESPRHWRGDVLPGFTMDAEICLPG